MASRLFLSVLVLLWLSPEHSLARTGRQSARYIFWHLTPGEGATPEWVTKVESRLRAFFEKQRGDLLMDGMTMDSLIMVEGNEKYLRCGMGPVCLSGLGEIAGIPYIIAGSVHQKAHRTKVELVLVDSARKQVVCRSTVENAGPPSQQNMEELAVAMFETERYRGNLQVACDVPGAEVFLDGEKVGVTPLERPILGVPAGRHRIEVKKQGHQDFSLDVRVSMDKTSRVEALLPRQAASTPFYQDWVFWTSAGVGVATTVVAVILHNLANTKQAEADTAKEGHVANWRALQDEADNLYLGTYIAYGIGGAGLLAAVVVMVLDLAGNPADAGPGQQLSAFRLDPWASGAGVSLTIRF